MQLRLATGAALMALCVGTVCADRITVDGQTHHDVIVAETNALYYVMFPETGRTAGYPKSAVDAGSVEIEPDPEKRQALRARFEANRPPLPEPPKEPGPRLLRDPAPAEPDGVDPAAPAAPPLASPTPPPAAAGPRAYGAAAPGSPRAFGAAAGTYEPAEGAETPAWRRSQTGAAQPRVPRPLPEYHPAHPASQAGVAPTAPAESAVADPGTGDPRRVAWTEEPAPLDARAAAAEYPAAPPEAPVVIEHEAYTDAEGVKTLVIKGNRQRDPYREARLAQQYRAALAAEAEARAREEAAMAAAQAAAEQAAYQQWLAEQAFLDEYAAQQFYHSGPQVLHDGTGYHLVEPTPHGWYAPEAFDPSIYQGGY